MTRTCRACGDPLPEQARGRPRIWCSERCRKAQYARPCADCGGPVSGTTPSRAPQRCATCSRAHQHATRRWTGPRVIEALRAYADAHDGRPPSADPRINPPGVPATSLVQREFGSWSAAILAAGLTPLPRGKACQ